MCHINHSIIGRAQAAYWTIIVSKIIDIHTYLGKRIKRVRLEYPVVDAFIGLQRVQIKVKIG